MEWRQAMRAAGRGSFTLDIEVEDVDAEYQRILTLGAAVIKLPQSYTWGSRSMWFCDPDGTGTTTTGTPGTAAATPGPSTALAAKDSTALIVAPGDIDLRANFNHLTEDRPSAYPNCVGTVLMYVASGPGKHAMDKPVLQAAKDQRLIGGKDPLLKDTYVHDKNGVYTFTAISPPCENVFPFMGKVTN